MRVTEILTLKTKTRDGPHLIGHPGPNTPTCRCGTDTEHPVEGDGQIQHQDGLWQVQPTTEETTIAESAWALVMVIHARAHSRWWYVPVSKALTKHFLFWRCTQYIHHRHQPHHAWVCGNRIVHAGSHFPNERGFALQRACIQAQAASVETTEIEIKSWLFSEAWVSKHCPVFIPRHYISSHSIPARHVNTRAF